MKHNIEVQATLETWDSIDRVKKLYPAINELEFTNLKMDYIHYMVSMGNNELFKSSLEDDQDGTLKSIDRYGKN